MRREMPESEPKPRALEAITPGSPLGWKAVLKSGKQVVVHEIPATGSAELHVLHDGYVGLDGDDGRVSGTVTLIVDSPAVIVVDPGMVASRSGLLAALGSYGFEPSGVTDVVFSHHHPDHTVNAALFPAARSG